MRARDLQSAKLPQKAMAKPAARYQLLAVNAAQAVLSGLLYLVVAGYCGVLKPNQLNAAGRPWPYISDKTIFAHWLEGLLVSFAVQCNLIYRQSPFRAGLARVKYLSVIIALVWLSAEAVTVRTDVWHRADFGAKERSLKQLAVAPTHRRESSSRRLFQRPNRRRTSPEVYHPSRPKGVSRDVGFVTCFFNIGRVRDSLDNYMAAGKKLANFVKATGKPMLLFYDANDNVTASAIVNISIGISNIHLIDRKLKDTIAGQFYTKMVEALTLMRLSPGKPKGVSAVLNKPVEYLQINHAKLHLLTIAASLMPKVGLWTFVDFGIYRHGHAESLDASKLGCMETDTARLSTSSRPYSAWAPYQNYVYLVGRRREVAGGVMTFDAQYLVEKFSPMYFGLFTQMLTRGEVTTEQGLLTILIQRLGEIDHVETGYNDIARDMLNCHPKNVVHNEQPVIRPRSDPYWTGLGIKGANMTANWLEHAPTSRLAHVRRVAPDAVAAVLDRRLPLAHLKSRT